MGAGGPGYGEVKRAGSLHRLGTEKLTQQLCARPETGSGDGRVRVQQTSPFPELTEGRKADVGTQVVEEMRTLQRGPHSTSATMWTPVALWPGSLGEASPGRWPLKGTLNSNCLEFSELFSTPCVVGPPQAIPTVSIWELKVWEPCWSSWC